VSVEADMSVINYCTCNKRAGLIQLSTRSADLPLASGRLTITEPLLSNNSSVHVSLPLMLQQTNSINVSIQRHHTSTWRIHTTLQSNQF